MPRARVLHALVAGLFVALYLGLNLIWLSADRVVRDGDEEGHVGAAELIMERWGNPREGLQASLWGDLGEYPPLHAGTVGLWWRIGGEGEPGRVSIRAINLLFPIWTALGVAALVRPLGGTAALTGLAGVLLLPMITGLGRHFMPESASVAGVTWAVVAFESTRRRPDSLRFILSGLAIGLAFLAKQTSLLSLLPLLLFYSMDRGWRTWRLLLLVLFASLLVLPWLLPHFEAQSAYWVASAGSYEGSTLLRNLGFYPWAALWVGAGPPIALMATLAGLGVALTPRGPGITEAQPALARHLLQLACSWLGGALLLLWFLPRKDPRLLVTALPAVALLLSLSSLGLPPLRSPLLRGLFWVLSIGWWCLGSFIALPVPRSAEVFDERCPQRWFRPPISDDLGFSELIRELRQAPAGPVLLIDPPEIPCELRPTFGWGEHLGPALRRAGLDRAILREGEPGDPSVTFSWRGPVQGWKNREIVVPALNQRLWVAVPR